MGSLGQVRQLLLSHKSSWYVDLRICFSMWLFKICRSRHCVERQWRDLCAFNCFEASIVEVAYCDICAFGFYRYDMQRIYPGSTHCCAVDVFAEFRLFSLFS